MSNRMQIEGCSLSTEDLVERQTAWAQVEQAVVGRRRTGTGVRVTFRDGPGTRDALQALVDAETDCCGWAAWRIDDQDGTVVLDVTGPSGRIDDLAAMLGL